MIAEGPAASKVGIRYRQRNELLLARRPITVMLDGVSQN
jgi:hypothetical protein